MGGKPVACCRGFPSCYFHALVHDAGVWLGGTQASCACCASFDTLLGPEKTSGCGGCCSLAAPGLDRLTHPLGGHCGVCGGWGGGCGGWGCGGVLSVA